ncbi:MAG TPA: hypothetical protein PLX15_00325 [Candidatus Woesearchaeota archaeon]|mgnify:CR=1 FL=1|nr:hypothetical protein [Candidatus Woesearchaeota archaeon]
MRKRFVLFLALSLAFALVSSISAQTLPTPDCRYRSVCMNYSQCFENGTKIRLCYDVNKCGSEYILIETINCDHQFQTHCQNSILDYDETDIDCAGELCEPCKLGQKCKTDKDCQTLACDPLKSVCVNKSEKTSNLKAFAQKNPIDFWIILLGLYALFFAIPFIITRNLNEQKQKEFIITTQQKKLQNSIDIFYLMLEKKNIYKAKLAYQLATTIAEKIHNHLSEKDISDLEELREDYQKYITQFEPKIQKQTNTQQLKPIKTNQNKKAKTKSPNKEKTTTIPSNQPSHKETNKNQNTQNTANLEQKETLDENKHPHKKSIKPPSQERNDVFFVDENEFFNDEEPNY